VRIRRTVITCTVAAAALFVLAAPAAAHVEAEPNRVKRGKTATVEFVPEHGCDDSPIVEMAFKIPKGVTDVQPVPRDGFTATATATRVTFTDGTADAEDPGAFAITFTAPDKKTDLVWKVVQRCEEGVERWIEDADGELPAPVVGVGKKPSEGGHDD
jgi:uncharacterized protein YcnI